MATKVVMVHMKWVSIRTLVSLTRWWTAWICSPSDRLVSSMRLLVSSMRLLVSSHAVVGLVHAVMDGPHLVAQVLDVFA